VRQWISRSLDRMPALGGHVGGVAVQPKAANLGDARCAVRAENEAEYLRDQVVELAAFLGILKSLHSAQEAK